MISQNPYRLLGVFANDPLKVRTANTAKMRAFFKIGKAISFDTDAEGLLGTLTRTSDIIEQANDMLFDNIKKVKYALFWFHKDNVINENTISLINFNTYQRYIIQKSDTTSYSNYLNNAILSLIVEDYECAAMNYCKFMENCSCLASFKEQIGLSIKDIDDRLIINVLITTLSEWCSDIEWWSLFLAHISTPTTQEYVKSVFDSLAIEHIRKSISSYSETNSTSTNNITAAHNLKRDTASDVKLLCPQEDGKNHSAEAQLVLDKLAEELFNKSMRYYKYEKITNELSVYPTLQMVNYAMSLTHGSTIIDKATEFKAALEKDIDELPPASIQKDVTVIKQHIKDFCTKSDDIQWSLLLVKNCVPSLINIKVTLTRKSKHYIAISTKIADNALYNLDVTIEQICNRNPSITSKETMLLRQAWQLIVDLEVLDLDTSFVSEKLNDRKDDVKDLLDRKGIEYKDIIADITLQTEEDIYKECNDYKSLVEFVKKYPSSEYADNALFRIRLIEDDNFPKVTTVQALLTYKCRYPNSHKDSQVLEALNNLLLSDSYGTINDYKSFIGLYPKHPKRIEILERIDYLKFKQCKTLYEYQQFVKSSPNSVYVSDANKRIDDLLYAQCETIADYNKFILCYPSSSHFNEAMAKIEAMVYETAIQSKKYQIYIDRFPNGTHANELKRKLELEYYKSCKTKQDFQQYLQRYPQGQYYELAQSNIKRIDKKPIKIISVIIVVGLLIWGAIALISKSQESSISSDKSNNTTNVGDKVTESDTYDDYSTTKNYTYENNEEENPDDIQEDNEQSEYDTYIDNSLETGSKPYSSQLGKARTGRNYLTFKTSGSTDFIIIVKRARGNKYVNHIYIKGGDNATIYLPNGRFNIYFYSGKGWNPYKQKGELTGGFVTWESLQKDGPIDLYSGYGEYTLYPVQNGNLQLKSANVDEVF